MTLLNLTKTRGLNLLLSGEFHLDECDWTK